MSFYCKSFTYLEPVIFFSLVLSHFFNVCVCCAQLYIKSTPTVNNVFMFLKIFHNRLSKQKNCSNLFQMKVIADNVEIFLRPQEKSHTNDEVLLDKRAKHTIFSCLGIMKINVHVCGF